MWRRIGWWGLAAAVVGGGIWLVAFSPVLALDADRVVVTGAGTVVEQVDVTAVVDSVAGTPLPRLDTSMLRERLLEVPGVRDAQVARSWPRGLSIALVAREPVAAVPDGKAVRLLDSEGIQVGRADKAPKALPLVSVPVGDERTLAAVLTVLDQLPPELAGKVRSIAAESQDTVTMRLAGGARVDWGSSEDTVLKATVLLSLLAAEQLEKATLFDVSAPTLPVTRFD